MKAFVHHGEAGLQQTAYTDMPEREPDANEVKVKLKTAGLNHRDLFVLHRHQKEDPPLILGSDGAGVVETVGGEVEGVHTGDEVLINPGLGWQRQSDAPPPGFQILGLPDHGTFAESVVVPAHNVRPKPEHLSWEEAGVLPLGALTAYRVLMSRAQLQAGQTVLIPGIGSGVATYLLQMATAIGARVIVTSRSSLKREQAQQLGASMALDSHDDWEKDLQGEKVDVVIESVGAATFHKSLSQLRPGGTMVTFGASAGDEIRLDLRSFFYGQYNLLGSTMGSAEEFDGMLQFVQKHHIKPVIDQVYSLEETRAAMERLDEGKQFGKIAISIA